MFNRFEVFSRKLLSLVIILSMIFSAQVSMTHAFESDEWINPLSALSGQPTIENLAGFQDFSDPTLLRYIENMAYLNLVEALNNENFLVESIQVIYISDEYIEELDYNSKENIFFGYTVSELASLFGDSKYVFTLGENGQTTVKAFENYDDTFDEVLKDVAIGSGVILVCATVSVVTGGVAPVVSVILAGSAKTGAVFALSSGLMSAVTTGAMTAVQTGDLDLALKNAAVAGGEKFKWGAITGSITGGVQAYKLLKFGTAAGLTLEQVAKYQKESKYPIDVLSQIKNEEEYKLYTEKLKLKPFISEGRTYLVPGNFDLNYIAPGSNETNLERILRNLAPIDPGTNKPFELHHLRHNPNGTIAVMPWDAHRKNYWLLHDENAVAVDHGNQWKKQRVAFWKEFAKYLLENPQ